MLILPWNLAGKADEAQEKPIVFGTFNIHYVSLRQDRMKWEERRGAVVDALREGAADIIGFQEMETFDGGHWNEENIQIDWITGSFPEYSLAAADDPRIFPSTQPIFYKHDRFEFVEQGFFFFSPTPDKIYTRPWNGRFPSFCSWVRLLDRGSGERFYVYNLHFDAGSQGNRLKSAALTAERLSARGNGEEAVVVLGDFNAPKFFRPVKTVAQANLSVADTTGSTFHFNRGINILPAIDHVLYSDDFTFVQTTVVRKRYDGVWPGDHYPVFVSLALGDVWKQ